MTGRRAPSKPFDSGETPCHALRHWGAAQPLTTPTAGVEEAHAVPTIVPSRYRRLEGAEGAVSRFAGLQITMAHMGGMPHLEKAVEAWNPGRVRSDLYTHVDRSERTGTGSLEDAERIRQC